jgi:hypothetical protein
LSFECFAQGYNPPTYASHLAAITGIHINTAGLFAEIDSHYLFAQAGLEL